MKLASIETILAIEPIANADKIVLATVQGWQAVIKRDEFQVGDEVVFIPVDTVLQRKTWNEFLFKDKNATEIRLKTAKLRGVYSQGLILNRSILSEVTWSEDDYDSETLAALLGVTKYEKPLQAQLAGTARGGLPSWLRKSDEDNLQSNPGCLAELQAVNVEGRLKLDGSSMKVYMKDGQFGVCSRSLDLKETEGNSFWKVARELDLEKKLKAFTDSCLCGELVGPGIQGNPMGLQKLEFYLYDWWDIGTQKYLGYLDEMAGVMGMEIAPKVFEGNFFTDLKSALDFVNGMKYDNGSPAEGVVFRPTTEVFSNVLRGRLSVKIINQNYKD